LGVVVLIALIGVIGNFSKARSAPYFRIRRDATAAGWRAVLLGVISAAGIFGALQARQSLPPPDLGNLLTLPFSVEPATATFDVNSALSVTPDASGGPTRNPLDSPPTITPTAPTPSVFPTAFIATIPSQITPSPGASITIDSVATGISASLQPVGPGTFFAAGIPRLYVFFTYADMTNGMSWARAVVIDGEVVRSETEAWQRGTNGSAYHFFEAPGGGWPKGAYLIQFYIGDRLAAESAFTLQ
jgi:hypothetical protein